jgi:hypothetical protein
MSRSFINLRRVLFGVSCAIVFGFGPSQAFGNPYPTQRVSCEVTGEDYASYYCKLALRCNYGGWCSSYGSCGCGDLP